MPGRPEREDIGQAVGLVMERYDLVEELVPRRHERWNPARVNAGEPGTTTAT